MYWKSQLTRRAWLMEHDSLEQFWRCCWQRGGSARPLLCWRALMLVWALAVAVWSLSSFWGPRQLWLIYMTHWGICFMVLQAAFGTAISIAALRDKLPEPRFGLPWYVKAYWVLFNIAAPVAFLITVFYWAVLHNSSARARYAPNKLLDVSLHALNSVIMLVDLLLAGHPSRLLHIYQPVGMGLAYLLFGVIYYFAGGVDPWGNPWVYPVVNWSQPAQTGVVVTVTALFLFLMHLVAVALSAARDAVARSVRSRVLAAQGVCNDGFMTA